MPAKDNMHAPSGLIYDVFISYRQQEPDKSWVRHTLLPSLKSEGLRVCIDFECFRLGGLSLPYTFTTHFEITT